MFKSEDPFGVAAIVAYVACLSLTILLLSVPYFASYFINYYRKLHQIEEAIVRISENRGISNADTRGVIQEEGEHPPYSAVSVIENPVSAEEIEILKQRSADFPYGEPSTGVSTEAVSGKSEHKTISEPKKIQKTTEDEDIDKGQLSLLDDMFPMALNRPSEPQQKELAAMEPEEEESPVVRTTIQVYALLDPDCDLFIRGKAPFPHPKGIKMEKLDVGKYELILEEIPNALPISFWMNNKKRAQNADIVIEPGAVNECYPEFQEAF